MGQSVGLPEGFKVISTPEPQPAGLPAGFKVVHVPEANSLQQQADARANRKGPDFDPVAQLMKYQQQHQDTIINGVKGMGEGAAFELGGEAVAPVLGAALSKLPSMTRASKAFETILQAAGKLPVDTSAAESVASAAETLSQHGTRLPKVLKDFIKVNAKTEGPLTYETTKDFASNAGRLSATESKAITGAMKYKVTQFWQAMKEANREAAEKVGMGDLYDAAMKEYKQAASLQDAADFAVKWGKRALATAFLGSAGVAGYDIYTKATGR